MGSASIAHKQVTKMILQILPLSFPYSNCQWEVLVGSTNTRRFISSFIGSVVSPTATLEIASNYDAFSLTTIFTNASKRVIVCPALNEPIDKFGLWFPAFSLLESSSTPSALNHFWIPDPSPLVIGEPIALFGTPGGTPTIRGLRAGLENSNIFTYNHKSVSTGKVSHISQSIVCHDASAMSGFCGSVGISISNCTGQNFSFNHVGAHEMNLREKLLGNPLKEHHHGLFVLDPDFLAAYTQHVTPFLASVRTTLTSVQIEAIQKYIPTF